MCRLYLDDMFRVDTVTSMKMRTAGKPLFWKSRWAFGIAFSQCRGNQVSYVLLTCCPAVSKNEYRETSKTISRKNGLGRKLDDAETRLTSKSFILEKLRHSAHISVVT